MTIPQTFQCPNCGASLDYDGRGSATIRCSYCNSSVIVPETLRGGATDPYAPYKTKIDEIMRLVYGGAKIEAIKIYRETFGAGLAESKAQVERLEAGEPYQQVIKLPNTSASGSPASGALFTAGGQIDLNAAQRLSEMKQLIQEGNKIGAIKIYREVFGVGLADAKTAVEQMEAGQPVQQVMMSGAMPVGKMPAHLDMQTIRTLGELAVLVRNDKKLEAIKRYRELFGVSLADAKTAVEQIAQGNFTQVANTVVQTTSTSTQATPTVTTSGGSVVGCVLFVIIASLLVFGAVFYLSFSQSPGSTSPSIIEGISQVAQSVSPASPLTLVTRFGEAGSGDGRLNKPDKIAVDGNGNIYVGDAYGGRIQRFSADGEFLSSWQFADDSAQSLDGLAANGAGVVYVLSGGKVVRYEGTTGAVRGKLEYPESGPNGDLKDIALTPEGGLVGLSDKGVVRYTPQGKLDLDVADAVPGDNDSLERVVVDADGNFYISGVAFAQNSTDHVIFKLDADGKYLVRFGGRGDSEEAFEVGAQALAVDNEGRLYASDFFNVILVFDSNGRFVQRIQVSDSLAEMVITPQDELVGLTADQVVRYTIAQPGN